MTTIALPNPMDVREMFEGLLGRDVELAPGEPVVPTATERASVGLYVDDTMSLAAAVAADLSLTAFAGAAMGLVPAAAAADMITEGFVSPAVWENFAELLNIGASLLNHDGAPHVRLYESSEPGVLPANDVGVLLRELGGRIDLVMTIHGYGSGHLSVVRAH